MQSLKSHIPLENPSPFGQKVIDWKASVRLSPPLRNASLPCLPATGEAVRSEALSSGVSTDIWRLKYYKV